MVKRRFYYIIPIAILFAASSVSGFVIYNPAYAQEGQQQRPQSQMQSNELRQEEHTSQVSPFSEQGNFTFGDIASIQNDASRNPAWIAQGHWKGNLLSYNQTTNATAAPAQPAAIFSADFRMVMLNGSAQHSHAITNFNLTTATYLPNGTKIFNGTTTISMKEGPVTNVPTIIKINGEVIGIFPDPSKIDSHFGNTPIYGIAEEAGEQEGNMMPNATSMMSTNSNTMMNPITNR